MRLIHHRRRLSRVDVLFMQSLAVIVLFGVMFILLGMFGIIGPVESDEHDGYIRPATTQEIKDKQQHEQEDRLIADMRKAAQETL